MNSDGRMDIHEFSIAMKLIKLKLQGHPLPPALPPSMKQPPLSLPPQTAFGKMIFFFLLWYLSLSYFVMLGLEKGGGETLQVYFIRMMSPAIPKVISEMFAHSLKVRCSFKAARVIIQTQS